MAPAFTGGQSRGLGRAQLRWSGQERRTPSCPSPGLGSSCPARRGHSQSRKQPRASGPQSGGAEHAVLGPMLDGPGPAAGSRPPAQEPSHTPCTRVLSWVERPSLPHGPWGRGHRSGPTASLAPMIVSGLLEPGRPPPHQAGTEPGFEVCPAPTQEPLCSPRRPPPPHPESRAPHPPRCCHRPQREGQLPGAAGRRPAAPSPHGPSSPRPERLPSPPSSTPFREGAVHFLS